MEILLLYLEQNLWPLEEEQVPHPHEQLDVHHRGEEGEEPVEGDEGELDVVLAEEAVEGGKAGGQQAAEDQLEERSLWLKKALERMEHIGTFALRNFWITS